MSAVEIRGYTLNDLPAVLAILSHWHMAPVAPRADLPDPERTALEPGSAFVAAAGSMVVGIGSYWLRSDARAVTGVLAVHPDWLRQGIGARLHAARTADMLRRGARHAHIEADRPEAIAWYQRKFGCRIVGTVAKKHAFGLRDVAAWTVLEQDLR